MFTHVIRCGRVKKHQQSTLVVVLWDDFIGSRRGSVSVVLAAWAYPVCRQTINPSFPALKLFKLCPQCQRHLFQWFQNNRHNNEIRSWSLTGPWHGQASDWQTLRIEFVLAVDEENQYGGERVKINETIRQFTRVYYRPQTPPSAFICETYVNKAPSNAIITPKPDLTRDATQATCK